MTAGAQLTCLGSGPPVVLVHGSVVGAERTWRRQLELAQRWTLRLVNRPGFGGRPELERGDFEAEAPIVADALRDSAHLVGHSYGAVIALYAAALRPEAVRSLTVSEPGCLNVAADDPLVAAHLANGERLYEWARTADPIEFLRAFRGGVGSSHETPDELEGELLHGTRLTMRERPPWDGEPPLQLLAACPFPTLVISGGHSPVFERVCDAIADRLHAERAVVDGRGHTIPATGEAYNAVLERFLTAAERSYGPLTP